MALAAVGKKILVLGTCVPCMRHNASKIRVKRLELDENLLTVGIVLFFCVKYRQCSRHLLDIFLFFF